MPNLTSTILRVLNPPADLKSEEAARKHFEVCRSCTCDPRVLLLNSGCCQGFGGIATVTVHNSGVDVKFSDRASAEAVRAHFLSCVVI
jgi:hypothetical protein